MDENAWAIISKISSCKTNYVFVNLLRPTKTMYHQLLQMLFFFRDDDLLTCKNQQKTHIKKQQQINNTQCQTIANIPLALMKQFNLFPVARGIVAIIHSQYIL